MAETTNQQTAQQQPQAQQPTKGPTGPTDKRPSMLHFAGRPIFARPRRAALGDNGARLLAEVYIPFPLLGIAIKTGIWGQPKSESGGTVTAWVPEFSLPRKVGCIPNHDGAENAVEAFKESVLDAFAAWAAEVKSGKAQNVDAPTSRAVRSVDYTL